MKMQKEERTLKRLSDNFMALVILQVLNYGLPLLLIPYLIRVLGVEGFGIYSFVLAIIMYGVKMSDYGFELSGTYHISLNREDKVKKDEIFSSILIIKLFIAVGYLLVLIPLIFLVDTLFFYKELLFLSFGLLLGQLLFPIWFFQGMEKMRYIMYLNGLSKLFFFVAVFIFVTKHEDIDMLLFLSTLSSLVTGFMALYVAIKHFDVTLAWQPLSKLKFYLFDGWYIFTSKIAVEFYSTINIIVLGFCVSPLLVGYYAIAVKIMGAVGNLLEPLTRTVYPYLVKVYQGSSENFIVRNKQLAGVIFMVMLPASLLVGWFAEPLLELITGESVVALNVEILQILALALIVYLYGTQFTNILVTIKETKFLNKILFLTAGINVLLLPFMLHFYGVIGLAWLNVFITYFLTLTKGAYIFRRFGTTT
ncbi:oligosaccharide flippase family protein [bacterium]|nr:oligosaccharide flippase family protein [bacterium]MBU1958076.1 oligosaccharide flippase family protein [bacterium]